MPIKSMVWALLIMMGYSCTQHSSNNKQQDEVHEHADLRSGLKIEFGMNLGTSHTDTSGLRHFYVHSTAIIANDSTIPIHLHFDLATEYEYPAFCGDTNLYKAFVVPEALTPDSATVYNGVLNGQHNFLNSPLANAKAINKTLNPGDFGVVTIGILVATPTNCAAVPRAIFSNDNIGLYEACESLKNPAISSKPRLQLGVKLEYYNQRDFSPPEDGCVIIPFGEISYPDHSLKKQH